MRERANKNEGATKKEAPNATYYNTFLLHAIKVR